MFSLESEQSQLTHVNTHTDFSSLITESRGLVPLELRELMKKEACIVGLGIVGTATATALGIEHYYDLRGSNMTLEEVSQRKFIFMALPTPTTNGDQADTSIIEDVVETINCFPNSNDRIIILRSTVPPKFYDKQGMQAVISNPEFLRQEHAIEDATRPPVIVIGANNSTHANAVKNIYSQRFPDTEILTTDPKTAAAIKYASNIFSALKVIFANEFYDIAQEVGADYEMIRKFLTFVPWGTQTHTVIWNDINGETKRGLWGACFPKDLDAIRGWTNHESRLLEVMKEINELIKNQRLPEE